MNNMKKTIKKNIDNKLPIYKLSSKKEVLEYYDAVSYTHLTLPTKA